MIIRFLSIASLILGALPFLFPQAGATGGQAELQDKRPVYVLTMEGPIGPAFSDYLRRGLYRAGQNNAQLLVIRLNTPGGLLTSTREMASDILSSPIPVAVWVTPSGGHAASAGTFLLYAGHIAAMDEGTNVGAATPIQIGAPAQRPDKPEKNESAEKQKEETQSPGERGIPFLPSGDSDDMKAKALEDASAFIRGIAELRGRNAEWAEQAVLEADSLTAREALDKNVIDFIAVSLEDLLAQADGRAISLKGRQTVTLRTAGAPVIHDRPDLRTRFLALITDPNVAFLLMTIGFYGLILEFYNPGTMIPGTIGAICLIIGLFALNILPVNEAGLILMILGMAFMVAEAFVPSFGILGIAGLAAFIAGATIMFDTSGMPGMALDPGLIYGMAVFGALMVFFVAWMAVRAQSRKPSTGAESMIGSPAAIVRWEGTAGRVRIQGEEWKAVSDTPLELSAGEKVTVQGIDGLVLKVAPS